MLEHPETDMVKEINEGPSGEGRVELEPRAG